ncbi:MULTISPECIES: DUF362 domain-containing protein [Desulfosediminicola]|uniref:DUF362 domain-containing protein n=1 Tax=Desulfosediminicola TaxID=2886823 RepID=UPI0010ACEEF3|nr:DUF362 domain-containing protein [Desulfosediminicola ganghwensis]
MTSYQKKHQVILSRCPDYERARLGDTLNSVMSSLVLPQNTSGLRVLLKPNFVSSRGQEIACTNVEFLRAAAIWFRDHGAKVTIGDSPAFGSTRSVMDNYGMTDLLADIGCEPVNFSRPVVRVVGDGISLGIAREAFECDLLVNLPKLKAHNQMFVTGAVKNLFGTVVGIQKAGLHMRHGSSHDEFANILLELSEILPDNISLVDGIRVMHRSGPMDGDPLSLGCVGGAHSAVALDTALLSVLELPFDESPLWRVAAAAKHSGADPKSIDYVMEHPESFHGSGFRAPEGLNPIRFNPFRLMMSTIRKVKIALRG